MPNGGDRNWIRFCVAIEGFRSRYGRWPARVHLHPLVLENIRDHVLTLEGFARVASLVELIPDDRAPIIAEDGTGAQYKYPEEGFPKQPPDVSALDWFGHPELRPGADL